MQRCLQLAQGGTLNAWPNPLVGSVIVFDGRVIGEGFHQAYGGPHAEVNAVNSVKNKSLLAKSTLYVNLEPCSHFGKTPPCADLILEHKIPKVVIGSVDTNSSVAGKGIERLRNAGVAVEVGVLELEALQLNHRFFTLHQKKRPVVTLKWAESKDGFMDRVREDNDKGVFWITNEYTKQWVHKLRAQFDAIVVGHRTWINDNPQLNVRLFGGKSPVRVVLSSRIKQDGWFVFNGSLDEFLLKCGEKNIHSILIEGGADTLSRFISAGLWDEAYVLTGEKMIKNGTTAPSLNSGSLVSELILPGGDSCKHYVSI